MAVYELPELDYPYDALEPHIAAEIMELHHSKHHQNYVNGANAALEKLQEAREKGYIGTAVTALSKDLAFNLGGHTNHSIFWKNLSPNGGGEPTGALDSATGVRVLEALATVNREMGTTTVIITHNADIAKMAQRVLWMQDGQIVREAVNERPLAASELEW